MSASIETSSPVTRTAVADLVASLPPQIRAWAQALGFADAGIATLPLDEDLAHLQRWLDAGHHGGMEYLQRDPALRAEPARLRPGTLSVISARLDYRPAAATAEAVLNDGELAYVSRYALGRDYHRLMRARLLKLGARIEAAIGPHGYRVLTDSAPALEKALARNARLGWIGKNTLLLNRNAGSWFFLGEIYTDLALVPEPGPAPENHCGRCTACLRICPTQAIIAPYQLDARRCISYLTIEHHGPIPEALRPLIGNRIFGCDDCQLVCPWNRYAQPTAEADFTPRHGLDAPRLVELFAWDEAEWLRRTEGMALRRTGYLRWLRNLAVALGNAPGTKAARAALQARAEFPDDMVREHVQWALAQQAAKDLAAATRSD
jgi:epoxyqueuosine reductase